MTKDYSLAAKLLIVSGKLSGLNQGMTFYETPSGEKVNSRILVAYLLAASIEDLKQRGLLDYEQKEMNAIGGKIPLLVLTRKKAGGAGFEKLLLDKLEKPANLIDLVKSIIGGMYELPEYRILYLIRSEFDEKEYMRKETVKVMFFFSRQETKWIPEKVKPLVDEWLPMLRPVWEKTLALPWLKTAIRDCNFGFSSSKVLEKSDDDNLND